MALCVGAVAAASAEQDNRPSRQQDGERAGLVGIPELRSEDQSIDREDSGTRTDGYVTRTGNVLAFDGPFSTGIAASFELRLVEAVVFAGPDLPVILVLNNRGGLQKEIEHIRRVIAIYKKSGVVFEGRVNYRSECDALCREVLSAATYRHIDIGAVTQ